MINRKFGAQIQNLIKQKSNNHVVLKSRSFSFDCKTKPPAHITRKPSFADEKPTISINRTVAEPALIVDKPSSLLTNIQNDEQHVPAYIKECIKHMRSKQSNKKLQIQLLKTKNPQYVIRRGAIVDWIVGIHNQLKLFPQTLFIAVSYMDQFCTKDIIGQNQYYLLGATCLFIAGKFQQTYNIPCIRSIQQITDQYIIKQQVIKMESRIMQALNFSLIVDTPFKYLELYAKMMNLSDKNFYIAQYILQLSLIQLNFLEFSSSMLGTSVQYLVNKIRKISPAWPSQFKRLSEYDENDLKACAKNLCSLLERSQQIENAKNIRTKFSKNQFCSASNIRLQRKNQ